MIGVAIPFENFKQILKKRMQMGQFGSNSPISKLLNNKSSVLVLSELSVLSIGKPSSVRFMKIVSAKKARKSSVHFAFFF